MTYAPAVLLTLPAAFDSGARHAASAVISGTWEGLLLIAATALLLRAVPGTTARLRFAIWTMVFLVLAALPLAGALYGASATGAVSGAPLRVDPRWSYALAALWITAVVFRLINLGVQAVRLRWLWRSAVAVPSEALEALRVPLGKVQVCTSAELDRPSVIGFFAPRILIPDWLFEQLTEGELHQIVLHEMEHLRRRDDWMNLVQKVGLAVFPLNPALLWIDRRLATERELACDDGVLSRTHAPRAYATCLTSLAERRIARQMAKRGRMTALALGALGAVRRSDFSRRIESILSRKPNRKPATAGAFAAVFSAGVLGVAGVLAHAPNLVAFGPSAQQQVATASPVMPVATPQTSVMPVAIMQAVSDRRGGTARMQDAVFHSASQASNVRTAKPVLTRSRLRTKPKPQLVSDATDVNADFPNEMQRKLVVLTSWQDAVPIPVIVTLPDGRTFFATYTATPTRAGWIVFQL